MTLSKETVAALVDLIENKLAIMHINDCDDLRERMTMQRALSELRGAAMGETGAIKSMGDIPRRGRRRKVSSMLSPEEYEHHHTHRE
ncbi:MAG: hypothetical protein AB7H77_00715 [Bdellovibrionales bacterium]